MRALTLTLTLTTLVACTARPTRDPQRAPDWDLRALTASPLYEHHIAEIIPLGHLDPPRHTLPADHIKLVKVDPMAAYPVFAPASGRITWLLRRSDNDGKLLVRVSKDVMYTLDHVALEKGIRVGDQLEAGQRIGATRTPYDALDLGVINRRRARRQFAEPSRYLPQTLMADAPLQYFAGDLRPRLYAKVDRDGTERDGRCDYDLEGRLVGNWFADDVTMARSMEAPQKHIAFAYDVRHPAAVRISIGSLALRGVYATDHDAPDPREVRPESGLVRYPLYIPDSSMPAVGTLLIRMEGPSTMRVQAFARGETVGFTQGAQVYRR